MAGCGYKAIKQYGIINYPTSRSNKIIIKKRKKKCKKLFYRNKCIRYSTSIWWKLQIVWTWKNRLLSSESSASVMTLSIAWIWGHVTGFQADLISITWTIGCGLAIDDGPAASSRTLLLLVLMLLLLVRWRLLAVHTGWNAERWSGQRWRPGERRRWWRCRCSGWSGLFLRSATGTAGASFLIGYLYRSTDYHLLILVFVFFFFEIKINFRFETLQFRIGLASNLLFASILSFEREPLHERCIPIVSWKLARIPLRMMPHSIDCNAFSCSSPDGADVSSGPQRVSTARVPRSLQFVYGIQLLLLLLLYLSRRRLWLPPSW